jgi:hypothetical protein
MDEIIHKKVRGQYGWLKWIMWHMGIRQDNNTATKHVDLSPEVKKVFLDKLCEIGSGPDNKEKLAFTRFRAEELIAHHKLQPSSSSSEQGAGQHVVSNICQGMDLVSSVLLWHVVTDICLVSDEAPSNFRTCTQQLSNYIMHLVYQCKLIVDIDGDDTISEFIWNMKRMYATSQPGSGKKNFIEILSKKKNFIGMAHLGFRYDVRISKEPSLAGDDVGINSEPSLPGDDVGINSEPSLVARAISVSEELLKTELAAADRWEMMAALWVEMLCYIARNSDYGFHARQLTAGGEFLTHAKMVVFLLLKLL